MAPSQVDLAFTTVLPKAELHAHLSGSISKECLHEIWTQKRSQNLCNELEDPLEAIQPGGGFVDIVTFFPLFDKYIYNLVNDIDSVRYATESVLGDFERDGVRHLELRTTPRECVATGMSRAKYVEAVNDAVTQWNEIHGSSLRVYLILSIDRSMTIEQANEVVDLALRFQHDDSFNQPAIGHQDTGTGQVVGIDLCGNPGKGDPSLFTAAFIKAKSRNLGITVHFAEIPRSGTEAELTTLLSWNPDRLGHGIHIPPHIKEVIKERKLALELCLSCNVLGKLTQGGFENHHFVDWHISPSPVALGTDDVGIFGSSLSWEYLLAAEHFHLNSSNVIALARQAANAAFAGRDRIMKLIDDFERDTAV